MSLENQKARSFLDRCSENQDILIKFAVIAGLAGFIAYRIHIFNQFPGTWESTWRHFRFNALLSNTDMISMDRIRWFWGIRLALWILESINLVAYVISYWTRIPPIRRSEGALETLFPFAVSGIPFIIILFRARLFVSAMSNSTYFGLYLTVLIVMSIGSVISLFGVLHLRRSFAIRVEARSLVRSGPYQWVRHPIYLGYFVTFLGSCILHFNGITVVLYAVFVASQISRARLEEEKLSQVFPEYASYQKRTGMFLPKLR